MARIDVTPVVQVQVSGIAPTEVKIRWGNIDVAIDEITSINITVEEVDDSDNVVSRDSILVRPDDLPPGQLVALNNLVNHMIDQFIAQKGYTKT